MTIRTKIGSVDEEGDAVTPSRAATLRVALVGSLCVAALALTHFLFHWVLLTDALLRSILY